MAHSRVWAAALLAVLAGCGGSSSYSGSGAPGDPAGADLEPRSGLLFVADGDIVLIQPDGSGRTPLTHTARPESDPRWSPDGRRIAFVRLSTSELGYADLGTEVYVMNADGSGEVNLSSSEADDREPVWSPDGRRVAFVSDRDGNQEIYLVDVDGSGLRNLTNSPANEDHPRFFPDGRVAFTSFDEGAIFVVNADGSGRERLPTVMGGPPLSFAISPGGDRFAAQAPSFNGMVIADLDGTVLAFTDLLPPLGGDQTGGTPVFSPDGRSIIYSSGEVDAEPPNANIQRLSIDGPTWERLTDEPTDELDPVFGPDGRRIAFSRGTAGDPASFEVFVMDADGANPTRLTAGRVADWR